MTYRENSKNVNTMNSTNNAPVNLISSTYDPSRQMSYMNQSLKNTPKTNTLPPSTASYPQPNSYIIRES